MSQLLDLVREDLRGFAGYKSARTEALQGDVWLNANESAWANPADVSASSRRYPDPQPWHCVIRWPVFTAAPHRNC